MKLPTWRDLLGLQPRVQDLARHLLDAARDRGETDWTYDEQSNSLQRQGGGSTVSLGNIFAEYASSPRAGRPALLEKYSSMMSDIARETPKLWQLAAKGIYLVVRSAYDTAFLEIHARSQGSSPPRSVTWPLTQDLSIRLVYDYGASLGHVHEDTAQAWGQSRDALKQRALDNLRALQRPSWQEVAPGVHQLISEVSFDESLFLVDAIVEKLPFAASVVVMPVNRGVLFAADGRSQDSLLALLGQALASLREKPWPMSATLLHRPDGEWVEFTPTGLAAEQAQALQQINLHAIYRDQAELLQKQLGDDIFVGTFSLLQKAEGLEHVRSWCSWAEGVRTLMPQTQLVVLGKADEGERGESVLVEWTHVSTICGHRMQATGDIPPRFMIDSFPDEAEWQQLKPLGEVLRA
jgi:hypothetical protein